MQHSHYGHLAACAVAVVVALGFVAVTGGSAGGLGVLVAALACPVAMVVAMKLLMGDRSGHHHPGAGADLTAEPARERP